MVSGEIRLVRAFLFRSSGAQLSAKIQQTVSASEEILGPDFEPEALFVTGSGLMQGEFEEDLSGVLDIPVRRVDLARDADIAMLEPPDSSWVPELMDNAFALAVSEIVGIDGLNLSKRQFAAKKYWIAHKNDIIRSGILLGAVLVLALMNVIFHYYLMQKQADELDLQIEGIFKSAFPAARVVEPLQQMKANIKEAKAQSAGPGEDAGNIRVIDVLNDISRLVPKELDVAVSRFVFGPDNIQISGDTDTFNTVDDIKTKLEQGSLFKKITTINSSKDNTENRINFKLKIDL